MNKYLPIGSVVLLKDSNKRIMIAGVYQKQVDTDKIWDYSAVLYPEGLINPNSLYLFDHEQIERIYSIGYQDDEQFAFAQYLEQLSEEE